MKILYLHQYFNTPEMNGGTRSFEMARRLVANGHEVHLLTSFRKKTNQNDWFETIEAGIHVYWLPVEYSNNMSYAKRILAFLKFAMLTRKKAVLIGGDIIFATSTPLTIAIPAVYAAKKLNKPMVFEVRDLWPELPIAIGALKNPILKWLALKLEQFSYSNAQKVVGLSPGMAEGVLALGYQEEKDVAMIPNSSDLELFLPNALVKSQFRVEHPQIGDRPIIMYAGTFGVINGVGYAVDLAVEVAKINSKICFVLVGEGAERKFVEEKAKLTGLLGINIFVFDAVPKKEMPGLLASADLALSLFVDLKPMWTNSANKFFDALASGTPIVINYGGWQKIIIEETNTGFILSANDVKSSAKLLVAKIEDSQWVKLAGINARNLAKERFSRDKLALELESVLLSAVSEYKSS